MAPIWPPAPRTKLILLVENRARQSFTVSQTYLASSRKTKVMLTYKLLYVGASRFVPQVLVSTYCFLTLYHITQYERDGKSTYKVLPACQGRVKATGDIRVSVRTAHTTAKPTLHCEDAQQHDEEERANGRQHTLVLTSLLLPPFSAKQ